MSLHSRDAKGIPMIPTPTASDSKRTLGNVERDRTQGATLHEGITKLIERGVLPTPTATDCKASGVAGNWTRESGRNAGATLTDVAVRKIEAGSSETAEPTGIGAMLLNPRFVEWMMGLPTGWALTPINSTSSGMVLSRKVRRVRSPSSGVDSTAQISMFDTPDVPDKE